MQVPQKPILVTGASGYIASHTIKKLLEQGYKVRGTVRSVANKEKNKFLYDLVPEKSSNLELVEAELLKPESWPKAIEGCDYILHIASPITLDLPKDENVMIKPAVEGTLNVLNAAVKKGVKKVVITSSCLTIMVGIDDKILGPEDWSDESKCDAYTKSKVKAEKAAWKFYEEHKGQIEIATVLPGFVMGPVFKSVGGSSESFIQQVMTGKMSAMPNVSSPMVDVRDVAEAHIKVMNLPNSDGKRYILSPKVMWFKDNAAVLRGEFGRYGYKIPTGTVPNCLISFAALFSRQAKSAKPLLGHWREFDTSLTDKELGIKFIPVEQALIDLAYSLIRLGAIPDKINTGKH